MRRLSTLAAVWALTLSTVSAAEPETRFPYTAFVAPEQAAVRSGPAELYYPVLHLKRSDAVEVWRHDPGGWCAVRPPEGSFSWISSDFVESADGRHGIVSGSRVNVRVGTQFSDMRDAVQLQLNEGDEVEILERRELVAPHGAVGEAQRWYKIAPPAGEFRWVHERDLVRDLNQVPADAPTDGVRQASFEQPAPPRDAVRERLDALPSDASTAAILNELEAALSQMVVNEPTAWHFAELERRGEELVNRATTAVERSQARLFLGKIARFADIQKRYTAVAHIRTATAEVDHQLTASAPPAKPKTALDGTLDTARYDGVGRLTQIVIREGNAAGYALTDETGRITAYVLPAPGVNLRQYVGLDVGINGIRGLVAEQGVTQITAKRVDVLEARTAAALRR